MAQLVLIDTWGFLSLHDTREAEHLKVRHYIASLSSAQKLVTTDFILDETFTLLFRRAPFAHAKIALESIRKSAVQGYLQIENITPQRFELAVAMRLKYDDKPDISFTDLTSFVVMKELAITQVITGDNHFLKAGMNFQIIP